MTSQVCNAPFHHGSMVPVLNCTKSSIHHSRHHVRHIKAYDPNEGKVSLLPSPRLLNPPSFSSFPSSPSLFLLLPLIFLLLLPLLQDNERRLTGAHETSSIHDFSAGVANRWENK